MMMSTSIGATENTPTVNTDIGVTEKSSTMDTSEDDPYEVLETACESKLPMESPILNMESVCGIE